MTNNDFLRNFRYALELDPSTLQAFFAEGGEPLPLWSVAAMLKGDDEEGFEPLSDELLSSFLTGVITAYRGPPPASAPAHKPEGPRAISNNRILRALRIAFELRGGLTLRRAPLRDAPHQRQPLQFRRAHRNQVRLHVGHARSPDPTFLLGTNPTSSLWAYTARARMGGLQTSD